MLIEKDSKKIEKSFKYNNQVVYFQVLKFPKKQIDLINQNIIIKERSSGSEALKSTGKGFKAKFPDIFEKYKLPAVSTDALVQRWNTNWLMFWQNQLHFAIWCATTGCGVDYQHHLKSDTPMIRSLFMFHIYYQIRRILFEINAPLPQDKTWNAYNNTYNRTAYEKICAEFNVDPNSDWRQKESYNNGLGTIYDYWTNAGYHPLNPIDSTYDNKQMSFTNYESDVTFHIDYILQGKEADNSWTTFILEDGVGFTKAGIERINDSIRTYCWLILGSQSDTRTDILGTGTSFDAQKQFLANLEDSINSPVDLPSQIKRYQDTLKYASSKVDFVFGEGLYMSPSDMELQIGIIQNYNNEIVIATSDQKLGLNNEINAKPVPLKNTSNIQGTKTKKSPLLLPVIKKSIPSKTPSVIKKESTEHEDNKTSLIVGSIVIGLSALIIYEIY